MNNEHRNEIEMLKQTLKRENEEVSEETWKPQEEELMWKHSEEVEIINKKHSTEIGLLNSSLEQCRHEIKEEFIGWNYSSPNGIANWVNMGSDAAGNSLEDIEEEDMEKHSASGTNPAIKIDKEIEYAEQIKVLKNIVLASAAKTLAQREEELTSNHAAELASCKENYEEDILILYKCLEDLTRTDSEHEKKVELLKDVLQQHKQEIDVLKKSPTEKESLEATKRTMVKS